MRRRPLRSIQNLTEATLPRALQALKGKIGDLDPRREHDEQYSNVDAAIADLGLMAIPYDLMGDYRDDAAFVVSAGRLWIVRATRRGFELEELGPQEIIDSIVVSNSDRAAEELGQAMAVIAATQATSPSQLPRSPLQGDWETYQDFIDDNYDGDQADFDRLSDDFVDGYRDVVRGIQRENR